MGKHKRREFKRSPSDLYGSTVEKVPIKHMGQAPSRLALGHNAGFYGGKYAGDKAERGWDPIIMFESGFFWPFQWILKP